VLYITGMEETLTLQKEGVKVETETRSYRKWKKRQAAIAKASDNGRCWWIEQYLKAKL
jgi:hypothetical protein